MMTEVTAVLAPMGARFGGFGVLGLLEAIVGVFGRQGRCEVEVFRHQVSNVGGLAQFHVGEEGGDLRRLLYG